MAGHEIQLRMKVKMGESERRVHGRAERSERYFGAGAANLRGPSNHSIVNIYGVLWSIYDTTDTY